MDEIPYNFEGRRLGADGQMSPAILGTVAMRCVSLGGFCLTGSAASLLKGRQRREDLKTSRCRLLKSAVKSTERLVRGRSFNPKVGQSAP